MTKAEIIEWIGFLDSELKRDTITPQERKETKEKLKRLQKELIQKEKKESQK
ncbi:MAG: hypothetical protein IE885_00490 [Campylobacterales bacterium]|nr:hypothetical protein [Campylobacterales bacterium]